MNTPLKFVDDLFPDGLMSDRAGEAKYYRHGNDPEDGPWRGLHFVCPGCGHLAGVSFDPAYGWLHDGNFEKPTCKPSILHDPGKCGWHGYLTNGELVPC